jgi:hypothetical protein
MLEKRESALTSPDGGKFLAPGSRRMYEKHPNLDYKTKPDPKSSLVAA